MPNLRRFTLRRTLATFCATILFLGWATFALAPAASADTASVSVTPKAALRDSQVVTVNWSGFDPYSMIVIRQCEKGATDSTKCSNGAGGSVQEMSNAKGEGLAYFQIVSTEGTVNTSLPGANGTACGPNHDCDVVVTTLDGINQPQLGFVTAISFTPEATSCPTENMNNITGGGSGALGVIMPKWQIALCKGSSKVTVDYLATRGDEGGMQDFNCGLTDFAITEVADENGGKCLTSGQVRPAMYVPIANTALVFAYSMRNRSDQQRLPQIKLTADMLTQTMTGQAINWGSHAVTATKDVAIYALNNSDSPKITKAVGNGSKITFTATGKFNVGDTVVVEDVNPPGYNGEYEISDVTNVDDSNPELGQTDFTVDGNYKRTYSQGGVVNATNLLPGSISVYGRADASGLNFLMTRYFLERAADAFHEPGGAFSVEGFPGPSMYMPLANSLDSGAFRSNSDAVVAAMRGSDDPTGGVGFIAPMDAATAKFNGFPTVSIANSDGTKFITPTSDSINLGISEMVKDDKTGVSSANLAPKDVNAYPLVFTVYAMVPLQTESKSVATALKAFLAHVRDHSSPDSLIDGYVPLTEAQKDQITQSLTKISGPVESPSPSPSPSVSHSADPVVPITPTPIDTPPTDGGGIVTPIDTGGTDTGGSNGATIDLPSIFASPFLPSTGAAAGIVPLLILTGIAASVVGSVRKARLGI